MAWRAVCACTVVVVAVACAGGDDGGVDLERVDGRESPTSESESPTTTQGGMRHDPSLASEIPAVDGMVFAATEPPPQYNEVLPARSYLVRRAIEQDGVPHGFLTVVAPPDGMAFEEFEDAVVDTFFAGPVQVVAGEVEVDGGTMVASTGAPPQWATYGDEFVMEAVVEQDGTGRWAWFWNDLLWIVEGTPDGQSVVDPLARAQHELAPPDDYDTLVIAGELASRFADLADYWYLDWLRADVIRLLPDAAAGTCADQWLPFSVAAGPDDLITDADNLIVEMAVVSSLCDTFTDDFRQFMLGFPGAHDETIGATAVVAGDQVIGWVEDGIAFTIFAEDPAMLGVYRPFIEAFAQYQAAID